MAKIKRFKWFLKRLLLSDTIGKIVQQDYEARKLGAKLYRKKKGGDK